MSLTFLLTKDYNVFRNNWTEGAGGVFICVKKSFSVAENSTLIVDAELVWVKLTLSNMKQLHMCSFYRPPDNISHPAGITK